MVKIQTNQTGGAKFFEGELSTDRVPTRVQGSRYEALWRILTGAVDRMGFDEESADAIVIKSNTLYSSEAVGNPAERRSALGVFLGRSFSEAGFDAQYLREFANTHFGPGALNAPVLWGAFCGAASWIDENSDE